MCNIDGLPYTKSIFNLELYKSSIAKSLIPLKSKIQTHVHTQFSGTF